MGSTYRGFRASTVRQHNASVKLVVEYMKAHLTEPYSRQKMAALAGYAHLHYVRVFTGIMGVAPRSYFANLRMKEACRLLTTTSMSICEVGRQLGYNSDGNFSATFTRHMNENPRDYRRRTKAERLKELRKIR